MGWYLVCSPWGHSKVRLSQAFPSYPNFFPQLEASCELYVLPAPKFRSLKFEVFLLRVSCFRGRGGKTKNVFFFVRCKNFMLKIPATRKITSIRNNKGLEKEIPQGGLSKILRIHGPKQAGKNWFIPQSKNNFGAGFPDLPGLSE